MERWNPESRQWEKDTPQKQISPQHKAKRIRMARLLIQNAQNETSRQLALRLARRWNLTSIEIGV